MNSSAFDNLVSAVENESFSDRKVDTIKTTICATGRISSSQVAQLLGLLSFEDAKLEAAKMAYVYAVDPSSYPSVVNSAFSFSSSKAKLNEHIRQY